jgi:hypothetical protein
MLGNYYMRQYPNPQTFPLAVYPDLQEILDRLKAIDTKLGDKDCEAPEKVAWFKAIEDRLKALEEKV